MSLGQFRPGASPLHRLSAGWKALALAVAGTLAMATQDPRWIAVLLGVTGLLYRVAGVSWRAWASALCPMLWLFAVLFLVQGLSGDWSAAAVVVLRLAALMALATLVTTTTRVSAMIDAVQTGLRPLRWVGLDPARAALAIALAIRFIPLVAEQLGDIREAQHARGVGRSVTAVAVPLVVRALNTADAVAEAIDARSFRLDD